MSINDPRFIGPPQFERGYLAEGQQGPPMGLPALLPNAVPPVLDSRAMMRPAQAVGQWATKRRALDPDPNKQRLAYQLGSILGPALVGKLAGGSGKQSALYGVGSAAFNYQDQLDRFKKTEQEIAAAELQVPLAEQQYTINQAKVREAELLMQNPQLQQDLLQASAYGRTPSSVQEYQFFASLPPDQQVAWLQNKRAGSAWVDAAGNYNQSWGPGNTVSYGSSKDAPGAVGARAYAGEAGVQAAQTAPGAIAGQAQRAASIEESKAAATDTAAALNAASSVVSSSQQGLDLMHRMLRAVENGPDTNATSDWVALVDTDLQELRGLFNEQTLTNLTAAKAAGATFGGMSEGEWKFLGQLGAQLGNSKAANVRLIKQKIKVLEDSERRGRESWNRIQTQGIRSLPPERRGRPGDRYLEGASDGE